MSVDQANGNVFVVNAEAKAVDIFGAEGGAPAGGGPAQITGVKVEVFEPQGIALDSSGDVYVAESAASKVVKFKYESGTKTYKEELVHKGAGSYEPSGVAIDAAGNVIVAAQSEAKLLTVFTPAGVQIAEIEVEKIATPPICRGGRPRRALRLRSKTRSQRCQAGS